MTPRGRSPFFPAAIIAATAAILASFLTLKTRTHEEPLPRLGGVPAFIVYDQTGAPFPSSRLEGSVWLADFFFTRCQGLCPVLADRMHDLQEKLAGNSAGFLCRSRWIRPTILRAHSSNTRRSMAPRRIDGCF